MYRRGRPEKAKKAWGAPVEQNHYAKSHVPSCVRKGEREQPMGEKGTHNKEGKRPSY